MIAYCEIPVYGGAVTLVDAIDYELAMSYKWKANRAPHSNITYAAHNSFRDDTTYLLHRLILSVPEHIHVDHRNTNGLDNRRRNLRACTPSQNQANSTMPKNNTSGYKGVSWDKERNKWKSYLRHNYRWYMLGRFDDIHDAAAAYNKAALEHWGEFARLNVLPGRGGNK